MTMTHKEEIEQLLIKGDLSKAIEEFLKGTKANGQTRLRNDLILQSARNNNNEKENGKGKLSADDYKREKARITDAVQSYLGDYLPISNMQINSSITNFIPVKAEPAKAAISSIKIFISYSSLDRDLRKVFEQRLKIHLSSVKNKFYDVWSDVELTVGSNWNDKILTALKQSNIGILLVSPMLLGSNYGMLEFEQMLELRISEGYKIVPVLARKCNFRNKPELAELHFIKTYQSEYGVTDVNFKDQLMPLDKLLLINDQYDTYLNSYFELVADAIDKTIDK